MKKSKLAAFVLILSLVIAPATVRADDMVIKLSRGLTNIVTSPIEYFVQYEVLSGKQNIPTALLGSVIYGTAFTLARICAGAAEVVTFPVPYPANYGPILHPATPIESYQSIIGDR